MLTRLWLALLASAVLFIVTTFSEVENFSRESVIPVSYSVNPADMSDSIFVSVSSYRDRECPRTLHDMFITAKYPHKIFVGLAQQNDPTEDPDCVDLCAACPRGHVRRYNMGLEGARGPTYARHIAASLYKGEAFYMQIDSHNRFVTHWDVLSVGMYWNATVAAKGNLKVVLSAYPNPVDLEKGEGAPISNASKTQLSYLCRGVFDFDGMFHPQAIGVPLQPAPFLTPYASAGFIFGPGSLLRDVPLDPFLPFLFWGEEFLYTIRMWTNGYDVYSPTANILFHFYYRNNSRKVWQDASYETHMARSKDRVRYLLRLRHPLNPEVLWVPNVSTTPAAITVADVVYGIGTSRSLEAWWEFSRIEIENYYVNNSWCRALVPVMEGNPWW